jgi:hypothetical protein
LFLFYVPLKHADHASQFQHYLCFQKIHRVRPNQCLLQLFILLYVFFPCTVNWYVLQYWNCTLSDIHHTPGTAPHNTSRAFPQISIARPEFTNDDEQWHEWDNERTNSSHFPSHYQVFPSLQNSTCHVLRIIQGV